MTTTTAPTKDVIRSRKSKKDKQYNGQMKTVKKKHDDLQNITQKTKDRTTRTPPKSEYELRWSRWVSSSCSTCGTRRVLLEVIIDIEVDSYLLLARVKIARPLRLFKIDSQADVDFVTRSPAVSSKTKAK